MNQFLDGFNRIEEFHSLFKSDDGSIDFSCLRKQAELLLEIRSNQVEPYRWIPLPQINVHLLINHLSALAKIDVPLGLFERGPHLRRQGGPRALPLPRA